MKQQGRLATFLILLIPFLLPLTNAGAGIEGSFAVQFTHVECVADGNNAHLTATLIKRLAGVYDAVCPDDQFDWYLLPLEGDLTWGGIITCMTDSPGLAVRLYYDIGAGPQLMAEASPAETMEPGENLWALEWDVSDIAAGLGMASSPAAVYYIRVTYYSAYPGIHPYQLWAGLWPDWHDLSPYNTPGTARALPPGLLRYGHLEHADPSNWYFFEVPPGQSGRGLIFAEDIRDSGVVLIRGIEGELISGGSARFDINLYDSVFSLIGTAEVERSRFGHIDLAAPGQLSPGTYYIQVANLDPGLDFDWQAHYMLFNHALAPDSGNWGPDTNFEIFTAPPIIEGIPISGSVYFPRDPTDFFEFYSSGWFLGDFVIDPATDFLGLHATILNEDGYSVGGQWLPGLGITCKYVPRPPGLYFFAIGDRNSLFSPLTYSVTYYEHGIPMTEPSGHQTWQTAEELPPKTSDKFDVNVPYASVDFQPGIQTEHYFNLVVPADDMLVGYYQITGSRNHYKARLGKLGPGGTPNWSPSLTPNSLGVLKIDLNYDFLSEAGTYFLKLEMLPSSPGRTRLYVRNSAKVAECLPDDNNFYNEAVDLKQKYLGMSNMWSGELCPTEDDADWYDFDSGLFDDFYGPKQNLMFRGSAPGMRVELYDGNLMFLRSADVLSIGDAVIIDLDGVILDQWHYYVKVTAAPAEDRVQVYDLELRNDVELVFPYLEIPQLFKLEFPFREYAREELLP